MTAAERWREGRRAWRIPQAILDAAPEDPWELRPEVFASRADWAIGATTPSTTIAREAMPLDGTVVDVGCGAGAASLPLATSAGHITGIDPQRSMLDEFESRMRRVGVEHDTVLGSWPEASPRTPVADIVVCHHVIHNVEDLAAFVLALSRHAGDRVVLEMTRLHPLSWLNDLWLRFHDLERPAGPTAADAMAVLEEARLEPQRIDWQAEADAPWATFTSTESLVAMVRRRLCLTADRDAEIAEALGDRIVQHGSAASLPRQELVTLWWDTGG